MKLRETAEVAEVRNGVRRGKRGGGGGEEEWERGHTDACEED